MYPLLDSFVVPLAGIGKEIDLWHFRDVRKHTLE